MSNPAVVTLASMKPIRSFPYRFEVEDNIGEAIHIHYKDIRLDLTVEELIELAYAMEEIIDDLVDAEGFSSSDFDAVNLVGLAGLLPDLEFVEYTEMFLEDMLVDTYDEKTGKPVLRSLKQSRIVKALQGNCFENDMREQVNYFDNGDASRQTNSERLEFNLRQIKEQGYPVNRELILLFNDDNIIYDGQHRAGCLYYLYGNISVPVRRLHFKNNKYSFGQDNETMCKKVEVLLKNGDMVSETQQIGSESYRIEDNAKTIIIHDVPDCSEVEIDLSGWRTTAIDKEFYVEIKER